jgi:hypothetical protein
VLHREHQLLGGDAPVSDAKRGHGRHLSIRRCTGRSGRVPVSSHDGATDDHVAGVEDEVRGRRSDRDFDGDLAREARLRRIDPKRERITSRQGGRGKATVRARGREGEPGSCRLPAGGCFARRCAGARAGQRARASGDDDQGRQDRKGAVHASFLPSRPSVITSTLSSRTSLRRAARCSSLGGRTSHARRARSYPSAFARSSRTRGPAGRSRRRSSVSASDCSTIANLVDFPVGPPPDIVLIEYRAPDQPACIRRP